MKRILITIALGLTLSLIAGAALASESGEKHAKKSKAPEMTVAAYYLHGTGRCGRCIKFEKYADEVIRAEFAGALEAGTLEWQVLNTDKAENEHFVQDFQLVTKALVVAELADGKVTRYKNLDKIWEISRDAKTFKEKFQNYVRSEVKAYLEGEGE